MPAQASSFAEWSPELSYMDSMHSYISTLNNNWVVLIMNFFFKYFIFILFIYIYFKDSHGTSQTIPTVLFTKRCGKIQVYSLLPDLMFVTSWCFPVINSLVNVNRSSLKSTPQKTNHFFGQIWPQISEHRTIPVVNLAPSRVSSGWLL